MIYSGSITPPGIWLSVEKKRHGRAYQQKVMVRGGLPGERARRPLLVGWMVVVVCGVSTELADQGKHPALLGGSTA